jgi:D-alanyl-D-alanine carboxypeptidase
VVEKVTGQSYGTYLRESIFVPLGMHGSGYEDNETVIPSRATGYRIERGQWKNAAYISMSVVFAAGATPTTVDDLLRWEQALGKDGFLRAESRRAMFTDYGGGYGLAWGISSWFGNTVHMHSGSIDGFRTTLCRYPDEKLTVIVLANLEDAPSLRITNELASLHFGTLGTLTRLCLHES